ncbi:sigma factor-like helix-turn-helix DNA-binding protein [Kineococcus vitellinus]|uniref:sigma factor-like helix-turn-helix DNA-binding protein n=1 Tax=Kineococcus vitellinus TaxID=2696565 RepID=UPI00196B3E68
MERRRQPGDVQHLRAGEVRHPPGGAAEREVGEAGRDLVGVLVVLETLSPAERIAFVLHDVFARPFEEVAEALQRSPDAARWLASRARRRVRGAPARPDARARRRLVEARLAAAQRGDLTALLALLDEGAVLRADHGGGRTQVLRGAWAIAEQAVLSGGRTSRLDVLAGPRSLAALEVTGVRAAPVPAVQAGHVRVRCSRPRLERPGAGAVLGSRLREAARVEEPAEQVLSGGAQTAGAAPGRGAQRWGAGLRGPAELDGRARGPRRRRLRARTTPGALARRGGQPSNCTTRRTWTVP